MSQEILVSLRLSDIVFLTISSLGVKEIEQVMGRADTWVKMLHIHFQER